MSYQAKVMTTKRDSVSTSKLVSPSFCKVHFSDVIWVGRMRLDTPSWTRRKEKQTDESPWDQCQTRNQITSKSV